MSFYFAKARCAACGQDCPGQAAGSGRPSWSHEVKPGRGLPGHVADPERISVAAVLAGELPEAAFGVYWTDTGWTECRPHLASPCRAADDAAAPLGVILYGPLTCDACAETAREAR